MRRRIRGWRTNARRCWRAGTGRDIPAYRREASSMGWKGPATTRARGGVSAFGGRGGSYRAVRTHRLAIRHRGHLAWGGRLFHGCALSSPEWAAWPLSHQLSLRVVGREKASQHAGRRCPRAFLGCGWGCGGENVRRHGRHPRNTSQTPQASSHLEHFSHSQPVP